MTKNNISELSTSSGSNTTIDDTNVSGTTGKVKDGDNVMRSLGAILAKFYDDLGAVNTVAGTANAVTVTTSTVYTALATGMYVAFKPGADNTGATTLNLDAIGAKKVFKVSPGSATAVALAGGELRNGRPAIIIYDAAADSPNGAWILVNPASANLVASSTDNTIPRFDGTGGLLQTSGASIDDSNNMTIPGTLTLTGGQLIMPGTAVPSVGATTWDDYEEGTTTPTLLFGGAATSMTFTSRSGKYTFNGNMVQYTSDILLSAKGSSTGSATEGGLPVSPAGLICAVSPATFAAMASIVAITSYMNVGGSMTLGNAGAVNAAALTQANFTDTTRLILTTGYFSA